MSTNNLNREVTEFLDNLQHPLRDEIDYLRTIILSIEFNLVEGIKWNGPNYSFNSNDRITIKIYPPKQVQVIFHRGAKIKDKPEERLLKDEYSILEWKGTDRAVATFKELDDIKEKSLMVKEIVKKWIKAT